MSRDIFRLAEGREITMPPRVVSARDENLARMTGAYEIAPGSEFRVTASDDGLRILAQGQEATERVFRGDNGEIQRAMALNSRAKSIYEAVMHENYGPLSEAIGRKMLLERVTANNQKPKEFGGTIWRAKAFDSCWALHRPAGKERLKPRFESISRGVRRCRYTFGKEIRSLELELRRERQECCFIQFAMDLLRMNAVFARAARVCR